MEYVAYVNRCVFSIERSYLLQFVKGNTKLMT